MAPITNEITMKIERIQRMNGGLLPEEREEEHQNWQLKHQSEQQQGKQRE